MDARSIEQYINVYAVERSAYRLDHDKCIVHLRMLSPDGGKTHVEYFSYTLGRGIDQTYTRVIENQAFGQMEQNMILKIGIDAFTAHKIRLRTLTNELVAIEAIKQKIK